jgi:transposase
MAQRFVACDRDQAFLLPPDVRDWLPAGHLARFVIDTVAGLDLAAFYGDYRADGNGRPAHDPAMMVALLLYAYAVGERSSRRIERRCGEDVAFRVIAANRTPDHATVARFRVRHAERLAALFGDVLVLCAKVGLVSAGTVAVDGTKLAANASLGANRGYAALRREAERIVEEAARVDAAEDALYGDARGDELPAELADPATRRARIRRALEELEAEHAAEQAEFEAKRKARADYERQTGRKRRGRPPTRPAPDERTLFARTRNVTDPDSRVMRDRGAPVQGYNAQALVAPSQVILAAEVTNEANDSHQLVPMLTAARQRLDAIGHHEPIGWVLADGGYWNSAAIRQARETGVQVLIPTRDPHRTRPRKNVARQGPEAERINQILTNGDGDRRYRRRKQIVEPVFAHIKHLRGIARLSRRGLNAARAEWQLVAATHNLLKLYRAAPRTA